MVYCSCLILSSFLVAPQSDTPKEKPKPAKPKLVTKFYRLDELDGLLPSLPFKGKLPGAAVASVPMQTGGRQGTLASSGQRHVPAFFNVPATQLGGGGLGGGGMSFGVGSSQHRFVADSQSIQSAIDLIEQFVEPDSWKSNGGPGVIVPVRNTLMIRTADANHVAVQKFLNTLTDTVVGGQPLEVDVWWLPLNQGERKRLREILKADWSQVDASSAGFENLNELTDSSGGHHGSLRTRAGKPVHATGGYRRPLVTGSQAVVGNSTSAYQPTTQSVNYGITLELTPKIVAKWREFESRRPPKNTEQVSLELKTSLTGVGPDDLTEEGIQPGQVDRYDIGAHVLQTMAICPMGTPVIVGSLAAVGLPPIEGDDVNEIYIVIRIRRQ